MKINKTALVVIAAGLAAAGILAYLAGTDDGKKKIRKLQKKGEQALEDIDGLTRKAKEKLAGVQEFFAGNCGNEKVMHTRQQEPTL